MSEKKSSKKHSKKSLSENKEMEELKLPENEEISPKETEKPSVETTKKEELRANIEPSNEHKKEEIIIENNEKLAEITKEKEIINSDIDEVSPYCVECYFDSVAKNYIATITEFSDIRAVGSSRNTAIEEALNKLEERLSAIRQRGESVPEPINSKKYPTTLTIAISQGLFRKLDRLSYLEKLDIDRLTTELIAEAVENRYETLMSRRDDKRYQQPNRYQQRGSSTQGDKLHGRNYHQTMQNRENFLEYVRSLEKSSRPNPRDWKKR